MIEDATGTVEAALGKSDAPASEGPPGLRVVEPPRKERKVVVACSVAISVAAMLDEVGRREHRTNANMIREAVHQFLAARGYRMLPAE